MTGNPRPLTLPRPKLVLGLIAATVTPQNDVIGTPPVHIGQDAA